MEGVGMLLYPELDIFEIAQPYAREAMRELNAPGTWVRRLGKGAAGWTELWLAVPQRVPRLLDQLQKGELTLTHIHRDQDQVLRRQDRMVSRLSAALLVAALIIGNGLIFPSVSAGWPAWVGTSLFIFGSALAVALGAWLFWNILRAGRG